MSSEPPVSPSEPTPPAPPPPADTPKTPAQPVSEVGFTRAAALWSSIFFGFLILIVLLIFVAQNTESASFAFLGWHWTLPLGVAILAAAVGGGLVAVLGGAARIFQLRRAAKKNLKAALKA
ncbi:lipopolysaccharide assembly protein LapA domain-containing protein [Mycobacterium sp. M26]|uniref:LapA family protein n=1 Tax=Mycobacterium sp. M26 TaxID=1762962 RepID=UPI00073F2785|nr:lipopolysaccharide assembly protein LapA domain-containing protein [Mycobacterium sp. M26]